MIAKRVTRTSGDRYGRLARYLAAPGDPGGTRTPYLQIRNLSLYPDELRDHTGTAYNHSPTAARPIADWKRAPPCIAIISPPDNGWTIDHPPL